jgi:hypothetical protein
MDIIALSLLSLIGAGALGAGGVKLNEYLTVQLSDFGLG